MKEKEEVQPIEISFEDNKIMNYDLDNKELISIRDGFQEYLGVEIGMQPYDKMFKIYRDPNTIRNVSEKLIGLPVTNEHIEPEGEVDEETKKGTITESDVVEHMDEETDSTIAVKNGVMLKENMLQLVQDGKNELSLGYKAKLLPHSVYDFQQVEIVPHHLAIVHNGRCGDVCKFKDGESMELFLDENGAVSLEKVMSIANQLPEAIAKMDLSTVSKLVPTLQKALEAAGVNVGEEEMESEGEGEMPNPEEEMEAQDMEKEDMDEEKVKEEAIEEFKDSQCFKDAMQTYSDERVDVIEKAKPFLDEAYQYKGKSNHEIMKDALIAEKLDFKDEEVAVAFKMLKAKEVEGLENFGDKKADKWSEIAERKVN